MPDRGSGGNFKIMYPYAVYVENDLRMHYQENAVLNVSFIKREFG